MLKYITFYMIKLNINAKSIIQFGKLYSSASIGQTRSTTLATSYKRLQEEKYTKKLNCATFNLQVTFISIINKTLCMCLHICEFLHEIGCVNISSVLPCDNDMPCDLHIGYH